MEKRSKATDLCHKVGCNKIDADGYCRIYVNPSFWWRDHPFFSRCPFPEITSEAEQRLKINPLKASRRSMKPGLKLGYKIRRYQHGTHKRKRYVEGSGADK